MINWGSGIPWSDFLGIIGVFLYIGSYFALQAGMIKGQGYLYATLNTLAAVCVLLSLVEHFNLSSALIQITYIAISVFGMVRFYLMTYRIQFTEEERVFLEAAAPNLPKLQARQFLDLGSWRMVPTGTMLTEEGEPLSHLFYLGDGVAEVTVSGKPVASLGSRSLVGEMSFLSGVPASATVTLSEPSRVLAFEVTALEKFLGRNLLVRHELESRFASQISEKLIRTNVALAASR